ncbi:MAG: DUF4430 domain-containing protein [Patescibacteria group bacterium]
MKIIAKVIIFILLVIIGFYVFNRYIARPDLAYNENVDKNQEQGQIRINLIIDFGKSDEKSFNDIVINSDSTVFDVLEKITSENNIKLEYKDYGSGTGVFIESINEVANDFKANSFWQYWVNNEYAPVGASSYQLKDGDIVEWKYVEGQI